MTKRKLSRVEQIEKLIDKMPDIPSEQTKRVRKKLRKFEKPKRRIRIRAKPILIKWLAVLLLMLLIIGLFAMGYALGHDEGYDEGYSDGRQFGMEHNAYKGAILSLFSNLHTHLFMEQNETGYHIWLNIYPWQLNSTYFDNGVMTRLEWFNLNNKPIYMYAYSPFD
jgi:hypothetical protein